MWRIHKTNYRAKNKFNKVVDSSSIQNSVVFSYTSCEQYKNEVKKTVFFDKVWINLTNKLKDLFSKNYKMLLRAIKEDPHKWGDTPCLWAGRLNIVKMSVYPDWSID